MHLSLRCIYSFSISVLKFLLEFNAFEFALHLFIFHQCAFYIKGVKQKQEKVLKRFINIIKK